MHKKSQVLFWIILFFCPFCRGQSTKQIQFLESYFNGSEKIVYGKSLPKFELKHIFKAIAKDTIIPIRYKYTSIENRVILTKKDRKEIYRQLDSLTSSRWYERLHIINSYPLSEDSIKTIFGNSDLKGWENFYKRYGLKLYNFSKPVFFRKKTLCLFYCGYSCGSLCGEGSLMIFRRTEGNWVKWLTLYTWIS